jgi:long-chain acyl-CoA synthetase
VNFHTLPELLRERIRLTPSGQAYRQFDRTRRDWVRYSWGEIGEHVARWRSALRGENLPRGARIGVLLPNSIEHVCVDQAALALGLVPVPMHVIDNPDSLAYVLADSGASILFVSSADQWRALIPSAAKLPNLKRVVYVSADGSSPGGIARELADWLAEGSANTTLAEEVSPVDPQALAAIVYTSGTTGRPKGVMLTHANVVANVQAIMQAIPVFQTDVFLSFLPLSHTFERTVGYYLPIASGAAVAFARSVAELMQDLATIRPTVLVSVPRIYERAHAALRESTEAHAISRALLASAVSLGWRRFEAARGETRKSIAVQLFGPVLDRWVGARVRARFGGRLRAAVSGGAPLTRQVARTFLALGVPLLQGYGMTETSPVVACNRPDDNVPESVGRPLPGVEVRIGAGEELLVRGPSVMQGYWRRPEETARVLEPDGWLHTGDQAEIVAGRIVIKGRLKDILVTSTGEKIAPVDLESAILADPAFEQAIVVGEGRPYIAALLVLNRGEWELQARRLGLDPKNAESLRSKAAAEWALNRIAEAVRTLPRYAQPRAVYLTIEPWTVGAGLITPTLKPKRPALEVRFKEAIDDLYRGHTV